MTAVRVGVGGWTFEPWRGPFYPAGLAHKRELEHASRQLTTIEVNGTYYGSQKPASFARWRDEAPEGFVFAVKGPRFTTNRKVLAEAGPSIERFVDGGLLELGDKLGPVNWQFLPTKQYDPDDFEAFVALLPSDRDGRALRHVVEVRHASFRTPGFVAMLRRYGVGVVLADSAAFPCIADVTAPFVYARLQAASEAVETGYPADALDAWAARARTWQAGGTPAGLDLLAEPAPDGIARDVFVYFINGYKPKAPAAAIALIERLRTV